MSKPQLKLRQLTVENVRNVTSAVLTFDPAGGLVQLVGENGAGKSAVLDGCSWLFLGERAMDLAPLRDGAESGRIVGDFGEIVVTRTIDGGGKTVLKVTAADGAKYASPQAIVDTLVSKLTFDPQAFLQMPAKAQLEMLRRVVPLDIDIDALDRANALDFEERTDVNRAVKKLDAQVALYAQGVTDVTEEPVDIDVLLAAMNDAATRNAEIEEATAERARLARGVALAEQKVQLLDARLASLRADVLEAERGKAVAQREHTEIRERLDVLAFVENPIDLAELHRRARAAEQHNRRIEMAHAQNAKHAEAVAEHHANVAMADALTARIRARNDQKAEAIARAQFPIAGLSFGDGCVLLDGRPFSQAEYSRKLLTSARIGMLANPGVKAIFVTEASGIGDANLRLLAEMGAEDGYDVVVERLEPGRAPGLVFRMSDGQAVQEK